MRILLFVLLFLSFAYSLGLVLANNTEVGVNLLFSRTCHEFRATTYTMLSTRYRDRNAVGALDVPCITKQVGNITFAEVE